MSLTDDFLARQRILIISPHADDETYGCAGTIARVKSLGGEVHVVLVTVADLGHYADGENGSDKKMVTRSTRMQEFDTVMRYLKVDDWDVLFRDEETHLALDSIPRKKLVGLIESAGRLAIDKIRPTMVMVPAFSYNQDHEALYRACLTATRPGAPGQKYTVPFVLTYDSTSLCWSMTGSRFHPTVYVDISDFLNVKIEALRMHSSQVRHSHFHGSPDGLELQTRLRGREVSIEAAEGYSLLRGVF